MLNVPNLDNRTFRHMVDSSLQLIRKYDPDWTDENPHDPGITLIEMFCWLLEMQQYYINQITGQHQTKFLKLLGVGLQDVQPAITDIVIEEDRNKYLPKGTPLLVHNKDKSITFEMMESAPLQPFRIDEIWVWKEGEDAGQAVNHTKANREDYVHFYPFGERNHDSHTCYISLEDTSALPVNPNRIRLTVWLDQYKDLGRHSDRDAFVPPARLLWEYTGSSGYGDTLWFPLQLAKDETSHLSFSGRILLQTSVPMKKVKMPFSATAKYWLRCRLEDGRFDRTPQIDKISLEAWTVTQWKTFCHYETFGGTGKSNQTIRLDHYLSSSKRGQVIVQVKAGNYWRDWHTCIKKRNVISFGSGRPAPPAGKDNIRVIYYSNEIGHVFGTDFLSYGQTTGLPHQQFNVPESIIPGQMQIQLKEERSGNVWEDWTRVESLEQSSGQDAHYRYVPDLNAIQFGDNVHGRVPEQGILRIISLRTTEGEQGNIAAGTEMVIMNDPQMPRAKSPFGAAQGRKRERLTDAVEKLQLETEETTRAVTARDYEHIALSAPGIRVGKVKVSYGPANTVTIAVSPQAESRGYKQLPAPPSQGFLQTVKNHIEPYRLVSTRLEVIEPVYVQITVHATLLIHEQFGSSGVIPLEHKSKELLHLYLQPHADRKGNQGWPFGAKVKKSDIAGLLYPLPWLAKIQDVWIQATGDGIRVTDSGDIELPWNGLVYSGEHQLRLLTFNE